MMNLLYSLLLIFAFSMQNASAQKMPSDYFMEGEKYAEAKEYKKAIASFGYIVVHNPKNELFPKAFYNTGYCYLMNREFDSSIVIFKSILTSSFNETESSGGGIMDDPYTNYRHRASELLSDIYFNKNMFDTALHYFAMSDTVYRYLHFCGNEHAANRISVALRYSEIYLKLGEKESAIGSLLPAVFITLSNNSKVIEELKKLLDGHKNIKSDLDKALSNIYAKARHGKDYDYNNFYIKFLNTEIEVPYGYEDDKKEFDKEKTIADVRKTDFYKMIESL